MELKELFNNIESRLVEAANEHYDPETEGSDASNEDQASAAGIMEALGIVQAEFGKALLRQP
jgi:hypothetical protein